MTKNPNITFNYIKHSSLSPIRQWTINSLYEAIIKELKLLSPTSILDVGCGEGFLMDRLHEQKITKKLRGIDISSDAITLGKILFPELSLSEGNINNIPLSDNSFDTVICTEVLEHLKEPRHALKELIRVSKNYLILSVPNEPLFSFKNLVVGKNILRLGNSKGHINQWTSWGFRKFVKKEKVEIIKTQHPFPFTLVIAQILP